MCVFLHVSWLAGVVVLQRLEQLAPFPAMSVAVVCAQYADAELCWVQEEPKNIKEIRFN